MEDGVHTKSLPTTDQPGYSPEGFAVLEFEEGAEKTICNLRGLKEVVIALHTSQLACDGDTPISIKNVYSVHPHGDIPNNWIPQDSDDPGRSDTKSSDTTTYHSEGSSSSTTSHQTPGITSTGSANDSNDGDDDDDDDNRRKDQNVTPDDKVDEESSKEESEDTSEVDKHKNSEKDDASQQIPPLTHPLIK